MSVYFVQAGEGGRIKIGYSPYPLRRIKHLQQFSGPDLITLAIIEGERTLESMLHNIVQAHRVHGEWFDPTPEVLDIVRRAAALPQDFQGSLKDCMLTQFTGTELDHLVRVDGPIGKAALAAQGCPNAYYFGVLAQLLRMFPLDGDAA